MKKNTLASHNIRILFWSEIFGSMRFILPVLTLFYFSRGLDESLILIVLTFWSTGVLVGEIPTGMFADRFGAKRTFLIGSLLNIGSHAMLFIAFEPWIFFISSFINGFAATFFSGADEALVYESLKKSDEEKRMDHAMGQIQSANFITTIFVVTVGAFLANDLSEQQFKLLIGLGVAFMSVQFFLLLFIKNPETQGFYQERPIQQVLEGVRAIRKAPQVLIMFMNVTLVFIPTAAVFSKFDQKLMVDASLPVALIGVVYAVSAFIGFLASRSIGRMTKWISRTKLLYGTGFLGVLGLTLAASFDKVLWMVLGVILLLNFVKAVRYPVYSQLSNELIPSNVRATTISLLSILDSIADIVIFTSMSSIAIYGLSPMLFGCALIALIGTLLPIRPAPMIKTNRQQAHM
ncbi:MFS transporter [Pontibacillus sp. HMF3514]|uniref:MFS transporter n=1 Tax=Pontibacillus sp. HMF3514 TaxID=2692425 RepID=UPI00132026B1|nr:MFS transporter [Pontibacillus sp. HMF3514]QHE51935.1 MFS transporter [Pontibacillus sp. HMF3514]